MNHCNSIASRGSTRPPIAILGVPFDNVTKAEAVKLIEEMIASRQPHYLVTPNVDFLVQARRDVELRRILFEAHLVVCDGTPLVWASRLLGNPLPERVAGADLVPILTELAAQKKYRLFLLGATPESARRAVTRLQQQYPELVIAGHYSPPFNHLLEMDHEEIKRRILAAKPDLLFVSFGCPKQEKWVAMHYRGLGVPLTAGVGASIDFLAGQVRRAPVWMQRSGTEWMFRLAQEPRRLFRRYFTDFWVFGSSIVPQWWVLQIRWRRMRPQSPHSFAVPVADSNQAWCRTRLPERFDYAAVLDHASFAVELARQVRHCVLEMHLTKFIDSTGVGWLIRLRKQLASAGRELILLSPSPAVLRALAMMRLSDFFNIASDERALRRMLLDFSEAPKTSEMTSVTASMLHWRGEVTAANAGLVWNCTQMYLAQSSLDSTKTIDLSQVRFIDSTGLGLMVRAKKHCLAQRQSLNFVGLQPAVRNVLRLSRLEEFLLSSAQTSRPNRDQVLSEHR